MGMVSHFTGAAAGITLVMVHLLSSGFAARLFFVCARFLRTCANKQVLNMAIYSLHRKHFLKTANREYRNRGFQK